ncbi:MAG: aldehyde ferredoxin oxidoreductase C-terminal domain-containing protein [Alphaproteobacteria bacterium]|jgi:aldehyde:ferredoxin oxidoreductase|nr:aldehyde ferredoxin oxidoreductase C-terminal domain-containing protein [Alphaproteobacteria bacterium]
MRTYLHIDLEKQSIDREELDGEALARAGRYLIAKTLLDRGVATVDPLSPENPLIFSAGPFAGTNFSNANRISVGCKSPLTGGIKESNGGGNFAFALGQLELAGFTLNGASSEWVVIRIPKEGDIEFHDASPYMGKGAFETAKLLFEEYGKKVSLGICGPVGEYQGLIAGIAFTDPEGRPVRICARGGVGAVMGSKKVKAIVVDLHKMPTFHDRKKVMQSVKAYGGMLNDDPAIKNFTLLGTAMVADMTNHMGGLPTRNFSSGQIVDTDVERNKMGGDYIRELNLERGGEPAHACMPGCQIQCSNVYHGPDGKELVSPMEYETIGLMGTNCGIKDPDDLAALNAIANDLVIDTIETGALLAVMMEAGDADWADTEFMAAAMKDIREGNERGRILAQGTARVGEHYGVKRVPVVKKQAISAYDPRVIEVTGISMMLTAQGADHTAGNLPGYKCEGTTTEELTEASMDIQMNCAAVDSLGICVFGRSVTNVNHDFITNALNDALGTDLEPAFFTRMGREVLELEAEFNEAAGFTEEDDELPSFFTDEALEPTGKKQRHHSAEVNQLRRDWLAAQG